MHGREHVESHVWKASGKEDEAKSERDQDKVCIARSTSDRSSHTTKVSKVREKERRKPVHLEETAHDGSISSTPSSSQT